MAATTMSVLEAPTFFFATKAQAAATITETMEPQNMGAPAPDTMTVIRLSTCVGAVVIDVGSA